MSLKTRYEFTLPRGYVDRNGGLHRDGVMRLATARDELEPLRDPTISGPDDPRLTIVVLARVVETLGSLDMVTANEIEGLFAADLAFLQDFYGVINFGSQEEFDEFIAAQQQAGPLPGSAPEPVAPAPAPASAPAPETAPSDGPGPTYRAGRASIEEIRTEAR
ncbi:hypothetical protein ACPPVS_02475 [Cellulomonas sp. McL0617]|uniref:hypothetical protein n=1 Tax=Cellulomonas sp. McL0617 TaxID=3415675 RepID=UPI003CED7EDA